MNEPDGGPVSVARPEEQTAAFQLLFQHCSPDIEERRVARACKMLFTGELDPNGLFVLRENAEVVGAVLGVATAGGIGMVWPPQAREGPRREEIEDNLARHVISWLRGCAAPLGQCLLHPDEAHVAVPLLRHGFRHSTSLSYLRRALELPAPTCPARLTFHPAETVGPSDFHDTLRRSYEGTLDFPEITGAITIEQAVAGHRGPGPHRPELWWLAYFANRPVGVLLLNDIPEESAWEIAYLGVTAQERREGFGRELVVKAITEAQAAGVPALILSVDQRNAAARQLYQTLSFEPFDSREVFLARWDRS